MTGLLDQTLPPSHTLSREERVARLLAACDALCGPLHQLDPVVAVEIGAAVREFITCGGNLARMLRISERGSHRTHQRLALQVTQAANESFGKPLTIRVHSSSVDEDK